MEKLMGNKYQYSQIALNLSWTQKNKGETKITLILKIMLNCHCQK